MVKEGVVTVTLDKNTGYREEIGAILDELALEHEENNIPEGYVPWKTQKKINKIRSVKKKWAVYYNCGKYIKEVYKKITKFIQ